MTQQQLFAPELPPEELLMMPNDFLPVNYLSHSALPLSAAPPGALAQLPALKATSLSRLPELQAFLQRCDDPSYLRSYQNHFRGCGWEGLEELQAQLKGRHMHLASEEQREYSVSVADVVHRRPVSLFFCPSFSSFEEKSAVS
jgi:hypothetical protein